MYKVIETFADLQDYNFLYNVGDTYPRMGMLPTPERIAELASNENRLRTPLIEEVPDKPMEYENTKVGQIKNDIPVEEAKAEDKEEVAIKKRRKKSE